MGVYAATFSALLTYLILDWWIGRWMHLKSPDIWILRGSLALLGIIAAGIFLWFHHRVRNEQAALPGGQDIATDDVDLLVHEAVRRLRSSRLGRSIDLGKLPLVFLIGESGTTKTTTIVNSSLDPELLAGQVHQESNILPTRTANIWYTRQAVFVDTAGTLVSQTGKWARLVKLLQPGRLSSAVRKGEQAPRAAVICYDTENFLKQGASGSTQAAARTLGSRLHEISQILGISFPVYVLFTKLDRVPFFAEYVRNLGKDEASQVLGATLPVRPLQSVGVYAEEEARRLDKAFHELFYSLAEKRMELLARENEADKLPGIYEFPRELRKLRTLLVQFLVDLGRPSQLRANPFLRGFYFSGVRAVLLDDVAPAAPESYSAEPPPDAGATRIFSGGQLRGPAAVPVRAVGSRKVPQWVFLTQLFNDVILKDRVALSASGFSTRVNLLRRILLLSVACIGLACCVGFLLSFFGNRALEADVMGAARDIPAVQLRDKQLPALVDLQRLDRLRQAVAVLTEYEENGPPWRLRWGLYVGDRLLPQARQLYFTRFHEILFGQTQASVLAWLRNLPDAPAPDDSYEKSYNALKAYLITTSYHEKSTPDFLPPVLLTHWATGREIDPERTDLARQQFEFYGAELADSNPYSSDNDAGAIAHARTYLGKFGGIDRYYLPLISQASQKNAAASFNEQFKDSLGVINSNYKVRGAFTRDGFKFMQDAIQHPSRLSSEEWVLGKAAALQLDRATLQQQLTERYYSDFVNEWRAVLARSHVVPFGKSDAEAKLGKLTLTASPLLEVLWFISHNTAVGVSAVSDPFMPVQALEPPGPPDKLPDQYVLDSNKEYIVALSKLQVDLGAFLHDPTQGAQAAASAGAARVAVTKVMGNRVDQQFHNENAVQQLLLEPIKYAEAVINRGPKDLLNGSGQGFCRQFDQATRGYYPFDPSSGQDLPLNQLGQIFAPGTGTLWTFYNDPSTKLNTYLVKQGSRYVPAPVGDVRLSPAFVEFFNRAAGLSGSLYADGTPSPKFNFKLGQLETDVDGLTVKIGSQSLAIGESLKPFNWSGTEDVQVSAKGAPYGSYSGPWAVFKFVSGATWHDAGPGLTRLDREMESNGQKMKLPDGRIMFYRYQLQVFGTNPFRPFEWSSLRCVPQVAR